MNNDLISREDIKDHISELMLVYKGTDLDNAILNAINNAPTVERPQGEYTIDEFKKWLYEIVFNNYYNDFGKNCLEIINRLDGFERFVADMREKEANDE